MAFLRNAAVAAIVMFLLTLAAGDVTIDPTVNNFVLTQGSTNGETVTVTVPAGAGVTMADVYLLADTTGSMSGPIGAVKAGAADIINGLIAELPTVDLAFGAGDYKDFGDVYAFRNDQSITTNPASVLAGISTWAASGGGDGPEGQLFAYDRIADDVNPAGGTIGWRSGAKRILVVFGDAPGHDPVCAAISGLGFDITEASVTAKLVSSGITFIAISTVTGYAAGLDDNPTSGGSYTPFCGPPGGTPGQATRMAAATGGSHVTGVNSANLVQLIKDLITSAVSTINSLSLVPTGDTAQFVDSITPASYGPLASDTEHVLPFQVNWLGTVACAPEDAVFTGTLDVVADGSVVAHKEVTITVPACGPTPVLTGRMTGGGSVMTSAGLRVTHGITLQCDASRSPNQVQVNWMQNEFHMETLTSALCYDDPDVPSAGVPFDTHVGEGTGRLNGQSGATAAWIFVDAGEPGRNDKVVLEIRDPSNSVVLTVTGSLTNGNHQAHAQ